MNISKYAKIKLGKCPACKHTAKQVLFNYSYAIYKCTKCNNIHV